SLEDAELLVRDQGGEVWRFRHGVLRDVAYDSLTKRERQRLHLQVADGLAESGPPGRYRQSIAYHLEQAARAGLDLDPTDRTLAGPEEGWGPREARILSATGEAHYWLGDFDRAASDLSRALRHGGEDDWTLAHASRFLGDIELNVRADQDEANRLFQRALDAS